MSARRAAAGGQVDRNARLAFRFDGQWFEGLAGDTLASALLANGVRLVGRSFKYHRPRGIFTAGPEEPNALVEVGSGDEREPNTPATTVELGEGLEARSQNRWPSLQFDLAAINGLAAPLFGAGFYYKTFMWPGPLWERLYEPAIRRAAGLGRASGAPDPGHYDLAHAFCDLLVVGAGPAGLAAALEASRRGARVVLCETDFQAGGRLLGDRLEIDGRPGADWAAAAIAELVDAPNVRVLLRTAVFAAHDGDQYAAVERCPPQSVDAGRARQRLWKIVARRTVLASGSVERLMVFGGNDRPGVMLASAVRAYLHRFAVAPGVRAAIFTGTDDGWRTAGDLVASGVEVAAVIDHRAQVAPAVTETATRAGVEILIGGRVAAAFGGGGGLRALELLRADGATRRLDVDLLAVSGGFTPTIGLASHLGERPQWSGEHAAFLVSGDTARLKPAGAAAGSWGLAGALRQGAQAAAEALAELGLGASAPVAQWRADDEPTDQRSLWRVPARREPAFVDLQHDVTDKDVFQAAQEGFTSVELMKRYTTLGMGTEQGKTIGPTGLALLAEAKGREIGEGGTILSRPPAQPVAIGALAGHHRGATFRPSRRTTSHDWAQQQGAVFVDAGQWKRAQWFAHPLDRDWRDAVEREVAAVRGGVGFCDVSTLGKIEVVGADAGAFLDRTYINTFSNLAPGRCRYGVMLREDGFVLDDGTVARLTDDRYVLTTTTLNAARVMQHLEFGRQVLWPDLDVQLASVTEQWAQFAVAGRNSNAVLRRLFGDAVDLSLETFPFMGAATFAWRGASVRLFRISFSGELAYEAAVPAQFGHAFVAALAEAGRPFGLAPYGTEALGVMRIEKGHAAGAELNGQTTARDLGLGKLMSSKKDYIGRRLAARPALTDPERPALVGLRPLSAKKRLRPGAHLLARHAPVVAASDEGHVTSAVYSPTLGGWIALALLKRGREREGDIVRVYDPVRQGDVLARVCAPVFVDPQGAWLHGRY